MKDFLGNEIESTSQSSSFKNNPIFKLTRFFSRLLIFFIIGIVIGVIFYADTKSLAGIMLIIFCITGIIICKVSFLLLELLNYYLEVKGIKINKD